MLVTRSLKEPLSGIRRSSRSLRLRRSRALHFSGRLEGADGRRRSGRDPSRPWRPVRAYSPASGIEGLLVTHHGEGETVGPLPERAADHARVLAARQQLGRVTGEVRMALAQCLAKIDDRL